VSNHPRARRIPSAKPSPEGPTGRLSPWLFLPWAALIVGYILLARALGWKNEWAFAAGMACVVGPFFAWIIIAGPASVPLPRRTRDGSNQLLDGAPDGQFRKHVVGFVVAVGGLVVLAAVSDAPDLAVFIAIFGGFVLSVGIAGHRSPPRRSRFRGSGHDT
jgi:hypothetical protein